MEDKPKTTSTELAPLASEPTQMAATSSESYAREYGLGVLKGAIGAIPYAGGLLNEVLFEARSRLKQQWLEKFVGEVAEAMSTLKEEKLDRSFLTSEAFSDLAEDILIRVARNKSDTKRAHFRSILVKGMTGVRPPDFSPLFLSLLEEMTDDELRIYSNYYRTLLVLRKRRSEGKKIQVMALDYNASEIMGLPPLAFRQVLQSFIRKGLIFDDSFGRLDAQAYTIVEPTELGGAFFEWISPEEVLTSARADLDVDESRPT